MSTQLVLGVAGAAVGSLFGVPQFGWILGSVLGGVLGAPDGVGPGDLGAPKLQQGDSIPRRYGTTRGPVSWSGGWISALRATENDSGGKGGAPEGAAGYSYSSDALGVIGDVTATANTPIAITRVWINGKLVDTRLATSDTDSLTNSNATDSYTSATLFDGNAAQVPWSVYEDAVLTANAVAYRNVATVGIQELQYGGAKTPPLVEVETITAGTEADACLPAGAATQFAWTAGADQPITTGGDFGTAGHDENWVVVGNSATLSGFTNVYYTAPGVFVRQTFSLYAPSVSGGCRYAEVAFPVENSSSNNDTGHLGVIDPTTIGGSEVYWGIKYSGYAITQAGTGANNGTGWAADGTVIMLAYKDGNLWIGKDGTWGAGGDPVAGTSPTHTGITSAMAIFLRYFCGGPSVEVEVRTEESQFTYAVPSGFGAWGDDFVASSVWTPGTADLQEIVDAELALNPGITTADHDTSGLAGVTVRGFTAVGSAAKTIAELSDAFWFDVIPGNPIRYVLRGEAIVDMIPFADTGAGVGAPGKPFTSLKRNADKEIAAVRGWAYPNIDQDHERGFERGDRLTTEGPDILKHETQVVFSPSEAKGRAITETLMARVIAHTADFGLSDKYAAAEPGDAYTVTADDGSTADLLLRSLSYADGVKACQWELYDTNALVSTGITSGDYTSSLTVAAAVVSNLVAIDGPILRDADDDAGSYTAVEGTGTATFPGAVVRRSVDDLDFSEIATTNSNEAIVGTASTALGAWTGGYVWDEINSVTVTLGDGQTLSSATEAAMQANRALNAAFLGAHGRWEVIRFKTATLVSPAVYTLTGLLRGMRGTEEHMDAHTAADTFVLATSSGLRRMSGEIADIGATRYLKAVTNGRPAASAVSESFVNTAVGLRPFSPTDLMATRDGSANITFTIRHRPRLLPRYGGSGGSYIPPSSGSFSMDVYATSGYATVVRTLTSTDGTFTYSAANQTTDFGSTQATVYTESFEVSAAYGRGAALRASA